MKRAIFLLVLILISFSSRSQKSIQKFPARQMEALDRGIVAIRKSPEEVFISWRLFGADPYKTGFNLYRDNKKLNKKPLTITTTYTDITTTNGVYTVKAIIRGKEEVSSSSCTVWLQSYLKIPLNRPPGGTMEKEVVSNRQNQSTRIEGKPSSGNQSINNRTDQPQQDRRNYTYSPGDASVGDLDSDGQYEIVLKWDPSNARDNAQDGYTADVILDAYELDGR